MASMRTTAWLIALAGVLGTLLGCGSDASESHAPRPTPSAAATASPAPSPAPTASQSPQPVLWAVGCGAPTAAGCGCARDLPYCDRGALARSDDLGETWSRTIFETGLGSVHFPSRSNGWAVGAAGFVVRTTDGGRTWLRKVDGIQLPSAATARGVYAFNTVRFLDENRGIIAGWGITDEAIGTFGPSTLYRPELFVLATDDGGATWAPASIVGGSSGSDDLFDSNAYASTACFAADGLGLIAGRPSLLTRDGGRSWVNIADRIEIDPAWGAACGDDGTLWLSDSTRVLRSDDRGDTWRQLDDGLLPPNCCAAWLDFLDDERGWRAGEELLRTTDGGRTWSGVDAAIPDGFGTLVVRFATPEDGLWTSSGVGGATHDGGASWRLVTIVPFRDGDGIFTFADVAVAGGESRAVSADTPAAVVGQGF